MPSSQIREVHARVERVLNPLNRQRPRLPNARITGRAEDRNAVRVRPLIRSPHAELLAQLRPGRCAFLQEVQVETVEAHARFHHESRLDRPDPVQHRVVSLQRRSPGKRIFVAQAHRPADSRQGHRRKRRWPRRRRILPREPPEDHVLLVPVPVHAKVALVPLLLLAGVGYVVVHEASPLRQRISGH